MSISSNTSNTTFILPTAGAGVQSITSTTSPVPTPKAHEVLVRVHAVSLNFRDYAIASGRYPLTLKENLVPGSDMAGEVAAVGDGVEEWKVGERVTANFDQAHLYGASRKSKPLMRSSRPRFSTNHKQDKPWAVPSTASSPNIGSSPP